VCGGYFVKRLFRVLVIEVRSCWSCGGRLPGVVSVGSAAGGAFSLFVESSELALFWLEESGICVDCVWKGCEEGWAETDGKSFCTI
jgi:hypothetical protein